MPAYILTTSDIDRLRKNILSIVAGCIDITPYIKTIGENPNLKRTDTLDTASKPIVEAANAIIANLSTHAFNPFDDIKSQVYEVITQTIKTQSFKVETSYTDQTEVIQQLFEKALSLIPKSSHETNFNPPTKNADFKAFTTIHKALDDIDDAFLSTPLNSPTNSLNSGTSSTASLIAFHRARGGLFERVDSETQTPPIPDCRRKKWGWPRM